MKIKHKLVAALVAATSLFTLALSASAYQGNNGGLASANFSDINPPIGYATGVDSFAWRADLYVSTNEDGKIKESDTIGNQLALVGSLLCTTSGLTSHYGTTYIQTNYTNETRDKDFSNTGRAVSSSGEDVGVTKYALPTLIEFDKDAPFYPSYTPNGTAQTVAIADNGSIRLFDNQYKVPTSFQTIQDALTKDEAKANEYTSEILEQLRQKDKSTSDHEGFLDHAIGNLNSELRESIKAKNGGALDSNAVNRYIFPNGEEPMVEWALVVTPMIHFHSDTAFYCAENSASTLKHSGCDIPYVSNHDYILLDAYWFAQSDVTSIALGKDGWYRGQTYNGSAMHINPNTGKDIGLLSRFLRDTSGAGKHYASAVASAAYSTETKCDPYLGVFNNAGNVAQTQWFSLLQRYPSEYAKRGGISVFTTKIEAPTPKIYYHLYTYELDEQNPPAGYTVGTTYTPKDLLQFTPNLGTPTVTSFSRDYALADSEYYYIPASDPKATENNNVPVAANDKLLTGKGTCQISLVSYQHFVDTNCFPKTVQFILVLPLILT